MKMNARAGNLIVATALATSLLGTRALADGLGFWDWVAVVMLFLVGTLGVSRSPSLHRRKMAKTFLSSLGSRCSGCACTTELLNHRTSTTPSYG